MEYEIWASDSGNRLFATSDLNEALAWALDYWLREGDAGLDTLSVGDELDKWVVRGESLRPLLRDRLWMAPTPWVASANDVLQDLASRFSPPLVRVATG